MGIPKLESELWKLEGCVINVSIEELTKNCESNVIVVDGFNFYGIYLYPKFDWLCCAFRELEQEIRKFVEAFERIGVKLVFFFVEGNLDEGVDDCGSDSWTERRSKFIEYTQTVFADLSNPRQPLHFIKKSREYYHTPVDALPVVLFTLQHLLHCEVHIVYSGDRIDSVSYYARDNKCLALLAQDNYYMFYRNVSCYISLRNLKLNEMTTVKYCPEALARHKQLTGHLYPFFLRERLTPQQREKFVTICAKFDECESVEVARQKITDCMDGKKIDEVINVDSEFGKGLMNLYALLFDVLRYNFGFEYKKVHGPLKKWGLIKLRAQELHESGQMSRRIEQILMEREYYNECILEDFVELPSSSIVYQPLRNKLYDVLFHDSLVLNNKDENGICESNAAANKPTDVEPHQGGNVEKDESGESSTAAIEPTGVHPQPGALGIWEKKLCISLSTKIVKSRRIFDYYMFREGCADNPFLVMTELVDPAIHPGLLLLWDVNNETCDIRDRKWQLFASCISPRLDWQILQSLPPTLLVPTVVLHYLFHMKRSWKFLKLWEIEVFIAQAIMLSKLQQNSLSQTIEKINARVVKLMSFFVRGCHIVRLLIQACGHPISEHDLCVRQYFEGKLFHSFYNRAAWRGASRNLCEPESFALFDLMRQIIVGDD